jgi:uroporphyrinogen decarboxylase
VLGFAGAPFTLASYTIEGGGSRNYLFTKTLMYRDEGAWHALMGRLARAVGRYLNAQIAAGAQAVQLFDSWVGCLGPDDYRRYVLPHTKAVVESVTPGVPVINFATGNPALLPLLSEAGGAVIGIDWRISLADAWQAVGYDKAVQGNLDPVVLLADRDEIRRRAFDVLQQAQFAQSLWSAGANRAIVAAFTLAEGLAPLAFLHEPASANVASRRASEAHRRRAKPAGALLRTGCPAGYGDALGHRAARGH